MYTLILWTQGLTVILIWPNHRNTLLCKSLLIYVIYFLFHMAYKFDTWNIYKLLISCSFQVFIQKYQYLYQKNLLVSDKKRTYMFWLGVCWAIWFHTLASVSQSFVTSGRASLTLSEFSSISRRLLFRIRKILIPTCFLLVPQPCMEQFALGI
jgi:hypothetical protein